MVINAAGYRAAITRLAADQIASGSNVCAHSSSTRCEHVVSIDAFGVAENAFNLRVSPGPAPKQAPSTCPALPADARTQAARRIHVEGREAAPSQRPRGGKGDAPTRSHLGSAQSYAACAHTSVDNPTFLDLIETT